MFLFCRCGKKLTPVDLAIDEEYCQECVSISNELLNDHISKSIESEENFDDEDDDLY